MALACVGRIFSKPLQQLNDPDTERIGYGLQRFQSHTLKATFQAIQVRTIQTGAERELLLAPTLLGPQLADPLPHCLLNVLQLPQE